ncbi:hypothetical protein AK812_SmicGene19117 [Symbiodinium microadriaticum]|uniref:Uncharacterized protein n=1 Tax=Symbiodinium microadriaticum TaxID=2951 RepID=A0A1Q9DTE0_SYMMI|nr:hypothetical protein AK812_SmicGene19117 [Symbiodinium microadriaticum]
MLCTADIVTLGLQCGDLQFHGMDNEAPCKKEQKKRDRLRSVSGMAREQVLLQEACTALGDRAAVLQRPGCDHLDGLSDLGSQALGITGNPANVLKDRSDSGDTPRSTAQLLLYAGHRQDRDRYPTTAAEDLSMLRRWLFGWTLLQHLLGQDVLGTGYRRGSQREIHLAAAQV